MIFNLFEQKKLSDKNCLKKSFRDCQRRQKPKNSLAVVFCDINKLKYINDKFRHKVGDLVISQFVHVLTSNTRPEDKIVKFGGDEYVIIMPNISLSELDVRLADIQYKFGKDFKLKDIIDITPSVSIGAVVTNSDVDLPEIDDLVDRADELMYKAKNTINHRVVMPYDSPMSNSDDFRSTRRNDTLGKSMRELFSFLSDNLSRSESVDSARLKQTMRNLWKAMGTSIVTELPLENIKSMILQNYNLDVTLISKNNPPKKEAA